MKERALTISFSTLQLGNLKSQQKRLKAVEKAEKRDNTGSHPVAE